MRLDIHHHVEGVIFVANPALEAGLSALSSALSSKDSIIASQSEALAAPPVGDSNTVSSAISTAIDAEDTDIAASISTILG